MRGLLERSSRRSEPCPSYASGLAVKWIGHKVLCWQKRPVRHNARRPLVRRPKCRAATLSSSGPLSLSTLDQLVQKSFLFARKLLPPKILLLEQLLGDIPMENFFETASASVRVETSTTESSFELLLLEFFSDLHRFQSKNVFFFKLLHTEAT